jgi:hypothetical protein
MTDNKITSQIEREVLPYGGIPKEELKKFFSELMEKVEQAEKKGFTEITVEFYSTIEPYEDYVGTPEYVIEGLRERTKKEIKDFEDQKRVEKKARETGLTFYEVRQLEMIEGKLGKSLI